MTKMKCPGHVVATDSTRFPQGEIMKIHDFQGFSLILVILANFMKFAILPPRKPSLYMGRVKKQKLKKFYITRKRRKWPKQSVPDAWLQPIGLAFRRAKS